MCGIVGLLGRSQKIRSELGQLMTPMFACMADRGPDSGGSAFFSPPLPDPLRRYNLYAVTHDFDWKAWLDAFRTRFFALELPNDQTEFTASENHGLLISGVAPQALRPWLQSDCPELRLLSVGHSMDLYKDVGHPRSIAARYRFAERTGSHCVGHTRMATESAVTPAHSHPYTAGEDFCLVHNGSLSNPYMLRRKLEREGLTFETDNDTEAACRYLEWRMRQGEDLETALSASLPKLDGFFTLLMATSDRLCLVRDAFACKPAVVAETDDYVAISSEFRSLAHLPGIAEANIFEPRPEEIYTWPVAA